ncbi:hypothetical protein MF408_11315 [Nocardioides sp. TF02-7]|nr:hypothetical protein MF408_11315 [Nocardioides sp. TF02-7]
MYENVGGISAAEPGYKVARIAPKVGGGLTHAKGELRTVYGDLRTDWNAEGDDFTLSVEVPVNTTAEVVLPAPNEWAVLEGDGFASDAEGVHDVTVEDGTVTVTVGSGAYDFVVALETGDLGEVLGLVDEAVDHVEGAGAAGDLTTDDADHLTAGLGATRDDLVAAVMALVDDDAGDRRRARR